MKFLKSLSTLFSLLALSVAAHADPLQVGSAAPTLSAVDQDGKAVKFAEVYAKGPTLVYFYPKANTPGCTKQACSIRDDWSKLQAKGIQVLGVSVDAPEAQKSFREEHSLPFTLIADTDAKVAEAFGVPFRGKVTARQSFLIVNGKITWNMLDKTTTSTHAADVLAAYEGLAKK